MDYNYFEVLGLSIDEIQDKDEATIKGLVRNAHTEEYKKTVGAYTNVPRKDGLTQEQWQKVLNDAKETLLDPRKRRKHIAALTQEPEELEQPVLTFPGGEEPRSIADLVTLKVLNDAKETLLDPRKRRKYIAALTFEVLGLSIDEIQNKDEATIKDLVSNAYTEEYKKTVGLYVNVPRPDGLTQKQWQKVLMDAEKTLLNPRKRRKYIAALTQEPDSKKR